MKKLSVILLITLLVSVFAVSVLADGSKPLVIDNADLLTESEEKDLSERLNEMSTRLGCDVIVLTEMRISGSAQDYADDYFDYNGYGRGNDRDGILLLVAMESRDWHVSGSGICNSKYISTDALEYIAEYIADDLGDERYAECFDTYANRCDKVISTAREGKVFKEPFEFSGSLIVSAVIGFIIAFVVTGVMKGKLKTVRRCPAASNYIEDGSLAVTSAHDMLLYRQVTRTRREKSSNSSGSHTSSSGRSHSGVGGKF